MHLTFLFFLFFYNLVFLFIYEDPSRDQSHVWEPDGRVEPSTTGESALRAAVCTQIDSSQHCMVPWVIPSSRTWWRNPKGSFLVIFSVYVLLFLFLDSFLDRQHASMCSCLMIVNFVLKVLSHLMNGDFFFPSKFIPPLRLLRLSRPFKNDNCSKLQIFSTTRHTLSCHRPQDIWTTHDTRAYTFSHNLFMLSAQFVSPLFWFTLSLLFCLYRGRRPYFSSLLEHLFFHTCVMAYFCSVILHVEWRKLVEEWARYMLRLHLQLISVIVWLKMSCLQRCLIRSH